jgi:hypothetical protein
MKLSQGITETGLIIIPEKGFRQRKFKNKAGFVVNLPNFQGFKSKKGVDRQL